MNIIYVKDFLATGVLGSIKLGMTEKEVEHIFGLPVISDQIAIPTYVRFYFENRSLMKINVHYNNAPDEISRIHKEKPLRNQISSNLILEWQDICLSTPFNEMLLTLSDLELIKTVENGLEYELTGAWCEDPDDEFFFSSGVHMLHRIRDYSSIDLTLGNCPRNSVAWKEDLYWV